MGQFIEELKRRNVFRVGIAYLVIGWVLVQVTALAVPAFAMPGWVDTVVFYFVLIGFPVALVLAWAFELTAEGIKREEKVDRSDSIAQLTGQKINYVIITALVLAIGLLLFDRSRSPPVETPPQTERADADVADALPTDPAQNERLVSIAVLPFADMSAAGDQEYFGDGIAEELLNALVKIEGLRVISRTSSFAFKNQPEISLTEIGIALNVEHVLEGSVRTAGNTIRVTAQLIEVSSDSHLWSQTFDRDLDDIFAIQDEISHAIVDALQITLNTENKTMIAAATSNMEAYDTYLQGKFAFARRGENPQALLDAVRLFEEATDLDPALANAYAGLGQARALLINFAIAVNPADRRNQMTLARKATDRALALDPDNVEAILSSAVIKYQFEADFAGADVDFQRAVSLSPGNPGVYNYYGDFLGVTMDFDQAIVMEGRAAELDPLSVIHATEYGKALVLAGRVDEGLGAMENLVKEMPDELFPPIELARMYFYAGRTEEAINLAEHLLVRWPANQGVETILSLSQAVAGDREALQELIDNNHEMVIALGIATVFFEIGDYDQAAVWLEQAYLGGLEYFELHYLSIADPRRQVNHAGLNEVLSLPGLKRLIEIRRRNLGLE